MMKASSHNLTCHHRNACQKRQNLHNNLETRLKIFSINKIVFMRHSPQPICAKEFLTRSFDSKSTKTKSALWFGASCNRVSRLARLKMPRNFSEFVYQKLFLLFMSILSVWAWREKGEKEKLGKSIFLCSVSKFDKNANKLLIAIDNDVGFALKDFSYTTLTKLTFNLTNSS